MAGINEASEHAYELATIPSRDEAVETRFRLLLQIAHDEDHLIRDLAKLGQRVYPTVRECRRVENLAREFAARFRP